MSDAELIACVIKSAYDRLPQAFRRDEFFFCVAPVALPGEVSARVLVPPEERRMNTYKLKYIFKIIITFKKKNLNL